MSSKSKKIHLLHTDNSLIRHQIHQLPSGLKLVEVHQPHLHRGAISVFFKAGSRFESSQQNGISHFLEHMMFRGTTKWPTTFEQNLAIEQLGGMLFAATAADCTEFEITLPRETLDEGVQLLATILKEPLFQDIDIERKVIAEEVLEDIDEDGNSIDIDFLSRKRLWPNHPLGQSITGNIDNIDAFSTDDIVAHYRRAYVANNAVVCLSGGFDPSTLPQIAIEAFSDLREGETRLDAHSPKPAKGPTIHHTQKPGSQTQLRLAFHAPGEDDESYTALLVLLGILDDGMSTRLHRRIFDELGLAYNISAGLESYHDVSAFNFDVSMAHKNAPRMTSELLALVSELRNTPVSNEELTKAKKRAIWGIDDYLDDPHGMAAWYGEQALFREAPSLDSRKTAFSKVTMSDIMHIATVVFSKRNLHLTTVGGVTAKLATELKRIVNSYE